MLYKKIHRQYLREFRIGRGYRYENESVYRNRITRKPYINEDYIQIDVDNEYFGDRCIALIALYSGKMWYKFKIITWVD